jgi:hypothetical protein
MGEELTSVASWERAKSRGVDGHSRPVDIREIDVSHHEGSEARARKQWEFWQRPLLDGGQGKRQREDSVDLPRVGSGVKRRNRRVRKKKGHEFRAVISHTVGSHNNNNKLRTAGSRGITSRGRSSCVQTKDPLIAKPVLSTVLESRAIIEQQC